MFSKEEVIRFFDGLAPNWDRGIVRNEDVIAAILENAAVTAGKDILDVTAVISNERMYQVAGRRRIDVGS